MKTTKQLNEEAAVFMARQNELKAELARMEKKEDFYVEWLERNFHSKFESLSESQIRQIRHHVTEVIPWDWMSDRIHEIKDALHENFFAYHSWHFENYGWTAI